MALVGIKGRIIRVEDLRYMVENDIFSKKNVKFILTFFFF